MSTLIVIAKAPVPGRVKTRLTPPFTPEEAAALAAAALEDTLRAVLESDVEHRLLVLDGAPRPRWLRSFEVVPQVPGTLDRRLAAAFGTAAARDAGSVLLVGMDTPQVTAELLRACLPTDEDDAVLGPAADGGFWSLGLRRPREHDLPALLVGVPMSTDHTGADQLDRLTGAGLRVRTLPVLRDVDTVEDAEEVAAVAPGTRFRAEVERLGPRAGFAGGCPVTAVAAVATSTAAWSDSVPYARALRDPARPLVLRTTTGHALPLDAARFTAPPDPVDRSVLDRCHGPTLDLGCGPGRLVAELARRGVPALGVDVCPAAVRIGRAAGAAVLRRSVFDRLPGTGRWPHALLMDGNIGIGGDPAALLARAAELVRPGTGEVLVETDPEDVHEDHLVTFDGTGAPFGWSRIGTEALTPIAVRLGFGVADSWTAGGRRFVALTGPLHRTRRRSGPPALPTALPATVPAAVPTALSTALPVPASRSVFVSSERPTAS